MKVQKFEHGATIKFEATFTDSNGNPVSPGSAQLVLDFVALNGGANTKVVLPMALQSGSTYAASWNSAVADPDSPAFWNARGSGGENSSEFGRIDFDHNLAGLPD